MKDPKTKKHKMEETKIWLSWSSSLEHYFHLELIDRKQCKKIGCIKLEWRIIIETLQGIMIWKVESMYGPNYKELEALRKPD